MNVACDLSRHPATGGDAGQAPGQTLKHIFQQTVANAAAGCECPVAVFYVGAGRGLDPWASVGAEAMALNPLTNAMLTKAYKDPGGELWIINDTVSEPGFLPADACLLVDQEEPLRFITTAPAHNAVGKLVGLLLVADVVPRAGLSGAQIYVLRAHAAQLALLFELDTVLKAEAQQSIPPAQSSDAQRLRLLESVVVNANDAVLITEAEPIDLPGPRIVYCNAAFTRTTGYSEAEILGRTPRILQSSKTDRGALARLRSALSCWEPIEVELLNRRKDGTEFYVELSIVPVANENGWFTHWVSVQRDVTDRKAAEETTLRARLAETANVALEAEMQERRRVEEQLLYAAFHDDLTKLRNRAFFMDRLTIALSRAKSEPGFRYGILFMDLDRFKLVNDSLGHRAGDLLLMEVANRMQRNVRPQDTLARIGGDEFALLVEGSSGIGDVRRTAERLIEMVSRPLWLGKQEVFPSCSIGIAEGAEHYGNPEEVLRDADIAMYRSKRQTPGGYVVFSNQMHEGAVEALVLETDLRNAVARGEFFLEFQPICSSVTGAVTGLEALIRWRHPKRHLVPPLMFIPMAEEMGLIIEIGRWVLREACLQMRVWQDLFPAISLTLSVNASGAELKGPNFTLDMQEIVASAGMKVENLQIEITESIFIEQPELIGRMLTEIRALGARVALDDFGTGYSSLSYLDRYPMDVIKIDRSFVSSMLSRQRTLAIVKAVVDLAKALDLDVVAEGVEEQAQLDVLAAIGCGSVQGYLLGRPMSREEIEAVLLRQQAGLAGR